MGLLKSLALAGGDWVITALGGLSAWALAVIVERFVTLRRRDARGRPEACARVESRVRALLADGAAGPEEALSEALAEEKGRLERRLLVLGTLGNNAPFIGLLGTVLGIIKAFHDLGQAASPEPQIVMQGLSEALIATAAGILVALPCVAAHNVFKKRVRDVLDEVERAGRRASRSAAPRAEAHARF